MASPLSISNVRIMKGVPLRPDYEHTRWFSNRSSQTSYFTSRPTVFTSGTNTYTRKDGTIRVGLHFDQLLDANYMMFQNEEYTSKWFYAFVTDIEYSSHGMTIVHFQIDVMQTWQFDINFKTSFIEREHRTLKSDGRPVVNTIEEGLNYGTDYQIMESRRYTPYNDTQVLVVISKEAMHESPDNDWSGQILATFNGVPQPLTYYVLPFDRNMGSSAFRVFIGDDGIGISNPSDFIHRLMEYETAVNNVVSIYVTDYDGLNATVDLNRNSDGDLLSKTLTYNSNFVERAVIGGDLECMCVKHIPFYQRKEINIGSKWRGLTDHTETKLSMYPYTVISLVDYFGNQVDLRPEYIPFNSDGNSIMKVIGGLTPSQKTAYYIDGYGYPGASESQRAISALEYGLINSSPNDIPNVDDYLSAMMQGQRNSMLNQANQAAFNGLMGGLQGGTSALGSTTMGKVNPLMAGTGVGQGLMQSASSLGNAQYQIEGIEAKQKDADNVPPNLVNMGGNVGFNHGNGFFGVFVVKKQLRDEYRVKLSHYFNMYGYKTQLTKEPNLRTRQNWNYVKTIDCNIEGDFNANDLDLIKTIFDNGVTLWHTNDIGNYSLSNGVI